MWRGGAQGEVNLVMDRGVESQVDKADRLVSCRQGRVQVGSAGDKCSSRPLKVTPRYSSIQRGVDTAKCQCTGVAVQQTLSTPKNIEGTPEPLL